jgi:CRISPR/Cas system endoribonuclease Cas6 (RAMP superfamily)
VEQNSYPTSECSFLLGSALSKQTDIDEHSFASSMSALSMGSSVWSIVQASEEMELYDEEKFLEELQENVSRTRKGIIEKERELEALEKQMRLESFRRTKQQAHYGDCFAIVHCAIFRFRSIMHAGGPHA